MATSTQGLEPFEVLETEEPQLRSREKITIASGQGVIDVGYILELSGTEYIRVETAGNAAAVALEKVDATSAAKTMVVAIRDCVVKKDLLDYNSLVVATVDTALKAIGIIPRSGPTYTVLEQP